MASRKKKPATRRGRQPPTAKRGYLTIREASEVLRSSMGMVYDWIKRGYIPAYEHGGYRTIKYSELAAYVKRRNREYAAAERERKRIAEGRLTDEEFMQRMIDNDPD